MAELRPDQQLVANLLPEGGKVMDVGCGTGEFLAWLETEKQVRGHGIELEASRVGEAVAHGLSVVQGDADSDLHYYADKGFDAVILGLTLQVMKHPKEVLDEALRIGKRVYCTIPNFGHYYNRLYLMLKGRMPVSETLSYQWYETPNIHFCTIRDMLVLCEELKCNVAERYVILPGGRTKPFKGEGSLGANLFAEQGVFVLER